MYCFLVHISIFHRKSRNFVLGSLRDSLDHRNRFLRCLRHARSAVGHSPGPAGRCRLFQGFRFLGWFRDSAGWSTRGCRGVSASAHRAGEYPTAAGGIVGIDSGGPESPRVTLSQNSEIFQKVSFS